MKALKFLQLLNMWESIKNYYFTIGEKFYVDPVIFVGIHVIATPLFLLGVAWIIRNKKKNKSIFTPAVFSVLIFNAANIYLGSFGRNIPVWIYVLLAITTIITSYSSYKKIKMKIDKA